MAKRNFTKQKVYKNHNVLKTVISVVLILLVAAIILAVSIFYGFQKYIVYTADGVRLEIPWLDGGSSGDEAIQVTVSGSESPSPSASASPSQPASAAASPSASPLSSASPSASPTGAYSPSPGVSG